MGLVYLLRTGNRATKGFCKKSRLRLQRDATTAAMTDHEDDDGGGGKFA